MSKCYKNELPFQSDEELRWQSTPLTQRPFYRHMELEIEIRFDLINKLTEKWYYLITNSFMLVKSLKRSILNCDLLNVMRQSEDG